MCNAMPAWRRGLVVKRSRREFIGLIGGVGVAAVAARTGVLCAQQAAPALAVTELRDGLHLISGAGGNVVARAYEGALLLVDSGAPGYAPALRKLFGERFGAAPVEVLFNTHWHLDNTGGNEDLLGERAA